LGGHWATLAQSRVSHSGSRSVECLFRTEQTPACTAGSLHVEVGRILTARAPNRRRSSRAFAERDEAGQDRAHQAYGRENGHEHLAHHRPRGPAARRRRILLQTQGLSRKSRSLAGIIRPFTTRTALPRAVACLCCAAVWTPSQNARSDSWRLHTVGPFVHVSVCRESLPFVLFLAWLLGGCRTLA
jgi:hypothetical protein